MPTGKAYVLNLEKRPDRLSRFQEFYNQHGPDLPLEVFTAIDGSDPAQVLRVPESIIKSVSDINDYNNKPSIKCTAYSHLMIWKKIAEGEEEYSLIFEDDCHFRPNNLLLPEISRESLKLKWPKIIEQYCKDYSNLNDRKKILFLGCGDLLPTHTCPPSASILVAQETNHVLKPFNTYYGKPNFNSPYVFDWLGLGSYLISKQTAKYLLAISQKQPVKFAVDSWIKRLYNNNIVEIYLTIPLFCYFPNILDSNTSFPEKGYNLAPP